MTSSTPPRPEQQANQALDAALEAIHATGKERDQYAALLARIRGVLGAGEDQPLELLPALVEDLRKQRDDASAASGNYLAGIAEIAKQRDQLTAQVGELQRRSTAAEKLVAAMRQRGYAVNVEQAVDLMIAEFDAAEKTATKAEAERDETRTKLGVTVAEWRATEKALAALRVEVRGIAKGMRDAAGQPGKRDSLLGFAADLDQAANAIGTAASATVTAQPDDLAGRTWPDPWKTTPSLFVLQRDRDVSGVSGTGVVAHGVLWPDGTVALRWLGDKPATAVWSSLQHVLDVHGHGGATQVVWLTEQPTSTS